MFPFSTVSVFFLENLSSLPNKVIYCVGPPGAIYYFGPPPLGSARVPCPPYMVPYHLSPGVPVPHSPVVERKANIVKQIEYYFR